MTLDELIHELKDIRSRNNNGDSKVYIDLNDSEVYEIGQVKTNENNDVTIEFGNPGPHWSELNPEDYRVQQDEDMKRDQDLRRSQGWPN